jgi:hypothetical protein
MASTENILKAPKFANANKGNKNNMPLEKSNDLALQKELALEKAEDKSKIIFANSQPLKLIKKDETSDSKKKEKQIVIDE